MNDILTKKYIRTLCGSYAYDRGETYNRTGKVALSSDDPTLAAYEATVRAGGAEFRVAARIGESGEVQVRCDCLETNLSAAKSCAHVAAVLLRIHDLRAGLIRPGGRTEAAASRSPAQPNKAAAAGTRLADEILGLFADRPARAIRAGRTFDERTPLRIEFSLIVHPYGYRKSMFSLELRVGTERLYAVRRIREFLDKLDRAEPYEVSKTFRYDPSLHSLGATDEAIMRRLIRIRRGENLYRDASNLPYAYAGLVGNDRMLPIPPASWESLLPLLLQAPETKLEYGGAVHEGIRLADGPMPLRFELDRDENQPNPAESSFRLRVEGLDLLKTMELYGVVLSAGRLYELPPRSERLFALLRLLESAPAGRGIEVSSEQAEPFLSQVVPGLGKLGDVRLAPAVTERIFHAPLRARLYLDRVKDRLLAGLEFQYGDIVLNPLEDDRRRRGPSRILMRDGDKEARILERMEQAGFTRTESGYFMEDEEAQYDFLYNVVPELEKLLQVYATSAVKARLHVGHAPPRIRVDADAKTDWLACKFELDGVPETEIRSLIEALADKRKYYKLPAGALMPLDTPDFEAINRFIVTMKVDKGELRGAEFRLPAVRGVRLLETEGRDPAIKLGRAVREMLDNVSNPDNLVFPVPESLEPVLRDYQKFGYQWMRTLAYYGFGGILADDMGLGKTIQSIAFLASVLPEIRSLRAPALVVCPASLAYNWRNELRTFAPDIRATVVAGAKTARLRLLRNADEADVLIVSYPLLRIDAEAYADRDFHTLILDEAQAIKNDYTRTAQAVKAVRARRRFALTGTPVENAAEEILSIYDAVFPELFRDRAARGEPSRDEIAKRIRPFLLRRLKTDVLSELPEKIESVQPSVLLPEQKKLYLAYLAKLRKESLKHLDEEGFAKARIMILAGLTRLRQICCHPALFVEGYAGSSAKFEQLLELLEESRDAGRRTLVFSQFTEMLGLIGRALGDRGIPFFYMDGQTPAAERVELCDRFNEGEKDAFLISLKAGGTGLNLTGADTVILYDLWWNPAVEQQAADRAHRLGQKNVVQVLRLVAQDTVEEKMHAIQQRKKNLIGEIVQPGEEAFSAITEQEIKEILNL
ncbi:SNF2 helicase associated domain-containing protein [Paenibacillaceae bacterium WGS1546]|uniref:DEAD/DEAH box helicase n=1 Tax=Cohnella sp. WGS1546 TaxID=3366810 RepID=UPI00372D3FFB